MLNPIAGLSPRVPCLANFFYSTVLAIPGPFPCKQKFLPSRNNRYVPDTGPKKGHDPDI